MKIFFGNSRDSSPSSPLFKIKQAIDIELAELADSSRKTYIEYWGKSTKNPCFWENYMAVLYTVDENNIFKISDAFLPISTDHQFPYVFSLFFPVAAWIHSDNLIITGGEMHNCIVYIN